MPENKEKMPDFLSTSQLARLLGVSRVAILKRIKKGKIHAKKVGRNYIIPTEEFYSIVGEFIPDKKKEEIENLVKKAVNEYRETFNLLGKE